MASSSNDLPSMFPCDIFMQILMKTRVKDRDMAWSWTGRQVSRAFKDAVERVFITKRIKKTGLKVRE
ncbi:hypothetical protein PQX77_007524, partial [Marasmius sp. AFHP31]